ncbi:MAG: ZIP family metal transporter [Halobacteriaceae archaeon]
MSLLGELTFVFLAGLVTALATGLGALPFFIVDDVSDRVNVGLWGLASGIMVAASLFGLFDKGLAAGTVMEVAGGAGAGVLLVELADRLLEGYEFEATELATADGRKLVLILGVLTVHSFPEGVAVGVSFVDLGLAGGVRVFGMAIPLLAIFMTLAISVHNIPEGLAISIPLRAMGQSRWRMVGAAVFSSLPQPIGAVLAYAFVEFSRQLLPIGFGFAAGAMIYLVLTEFIPEALETGAALPDRGLKPLVIGVTAGVVLMLPLLLIG